MKPPRDPRLLANVYAPSIVIRHILLVFVVVIITSCQKKSPPIVNPDPQKKVRIHGVFPFDSPLTLQFDAAYHNTNPACDKVFRFLGFGFEVSRYDIEYRVPIDLRQLDDTHYEAFYYQDYFNEGGCQWKFDYFIPSYSPKINKLDKRSTDYSPYHSAKSEEFGNSSVAGIINFVDSFQINEPLYTLCTEEIDHFGDGREYRTAYCYRKGPSPLTWYRYGDDYEMNFKFKGTKVIK